MNSNIPPPKWLSLNQYLSGPTAGFKAIVNGKGPEPKFFNRNLSWLDFNGRVLAEAADPTVPPAERLKFLGIVSSNLDEFFMVRVADVIRMVRRKPRHRYDDGLTPGRVLGLIRQKVLEQKAYQAAVLKDVLSVLSKEGIDIQAEFQDDPKLDKEIQSALPALKFIVRTIAEPLPPLKGDTINVFIQFSGEYAVITLPERESRLLQLPSAGRTLRFVLLDRWLTARAQKLFPTKKVLEAYPFKIIRDADLRYRPDDDDIEDQIVEAVHMRTRGKVVRLEVDAPRYSEGAIFLATSLGLDSASLYRFDLPLDLRTISKICGMPESRRLCYASISPVMPSKWKRTKSVFKLIQKHDILVHHPYDSFDIIISFLEEAAEDPAVTKIFHTMYRTSRESPVMEALKKASRNGKKVTVYIEIKARFDELNNVRWAQELKKAGVRVVRPLAGFKVHCKMTHVLRREGNEDISYLHLGTGNYHPATARQYTDLGLLTRNQNIGEEAQQFFSTLPKRSAPEGLKTLLVAPGNLHDEVIRLIRKETEIEKTGGKGHIIAKMNSLVDPHVINELYKASKAGVKIELLVRGICCLRPGVKDLSENITVTSVVDRFLEHSRIYYFRSNGEKKIYLSSADWMPRNFHDRYEIAFPIQDANLKRYIRETILANYLSDNLRAWRLQSDGAYVKVRPKPSDPLFRSQLSFEVIARKQYRDTVLARRI